MSRRLIGFAGRAKSGKTTLSNILRDERGVKVLTIASYLKNLTCELLGLDFETMMEYKNSGEKINAVPDEHWAETISEKTGLDKAVICEELTKYPVIGTVRDALQIIGTDIIRKYYPDWHIDSLIKELHTLPEDAVVAVDDVRFPNELNKIEEEGGEVFFILRPSIIFESSNHISETALSWKNAKDMDHVIFNKPDTTIEDLRNIILGKFDNGASSNGIPHLFTESRKAKEAEAIINIDDDFADALSTYINRPSTRSETKYAKWLTFNLIDKSDYKFIWEFTKRVYGAVFVFESNTFTIDNPLLIEELKMFVKN